MTGKRFDQLTAATSVADADLIAIETDVANANTALRYSKKASFTTLAARTETLTNKRNTKRSVTVTQSATPTINTDNTDIAVITGLAQAITSLTTNLSGTPVNGDMLLMQITDDGTGRAITPGASFVGTTSFAITSLTTIANKQLKLLWLYSGAAWELVGNTSSL